MGKITGFLIYYFIGLLLVLNSCKENVVAPPNTNIKDSATVFISPRTPAGYVNQKVLFAAQVSHSDTSQKIKLIWSLTDSSVASIRSDGICYLQAKGSTYVVASVMSAQGLILAKDSTYLSIDRYSFKFTKSELNLTSIDEYADFYNIKPLNILWSSDNNLVATVDSAGRIRGAGLGSTFIHANVIDSSNNILAHDSIKINVEWQRLSRLPNPISSMFFNPQTGGIMISTKYGGGIFASFDLGISWVSRNGGVNTGYGIGGLAGSSNFPNIFMALTVDQQVIKTIDGGISWQYGQSLGDQVSSIALHPNNNNMAFALNGFSDCELYKTTDFGENWNLFSVTTVSGGLVPILFIDQTSPQEMYIGAERSYRSTDGGLNWNELNYLNRGTEFNMIHLDNLKRIYAHEYNWDGALQDRLLRSSDFGKTWSVLKEFHNTGYYAYTFDDQSSGTILILTDLLIFYSTDDGQTWETIDKTRSFGMSIGGVILNSNPLEFIYFAGTDVWKYKKLVK